MRMSKLRRALPLLLLACVGFGAYALVGDVGGVWKLVVLLPLALVAAFRLREWPIAVAGVIVAGVFVLLGVDALWARANWPRIENPIASLLAGALVLVIASLIYLQPWLSAKQVKHPGRWAAATATGLLLVPIAVFWGLAELKGDSGKLAAQIDVVSTLDVIVLRDGGAAPAAQEQPERGWDVRIWSGRIDGDEVAWDGRAPAPLPAAGADRILLLSLGGPDAGETARWLRAADAVTPRSTPTFALLPAPDDTRLQAWKDVLTRTGDPGARYGGALVREDPAASTTDLALRLAINAPTGDEDLALAARHRPALFFDTGEKYAMPLNIDQMLKSGKLRLCERGQALRALCTEVHGSADLRNGGTNLAFDPADLTGIKDSAIYVNVTRSGNDGGNSIYLDYWWYLPYNPAGAARGAFCGAGFVIAGATCFDHQSDWEGVTVVLDGRDPGGAPKAVSYAQHEGVTRYSWRALRARWTQTRDARAFGRGVDLRVRPLVFVARGTHASYPTSCDDEHCVRTDVPKVRVDRSLNENRHDGGKPWGRRCPVTCVIALPTHGNGSKAARWNAYTGPWGSANCVLGIVCTSGAPPTSPSTQDRYTAPWCYGAAFGFAGGRFTRAPGRCDESAVPTIAEKTRGGTLLALGDSYSSGQGGGSYEPGGCSRSANAWPRRLAALMHLEVQPSLACSGARVADVTGGQIGRITGEPAVITLTIGGNDAGFSRVLRNCVLGDCVKRYAKPSGDLLEAAVAELEPRLPGVYRRVRAKAPKARLIVIGYPRPFPRADAAHPVGNCAAGRRITAREAGYLNARLESLNAAIARAAKAAGATYVDVTDAFDGAELRCGGPTFVNRVRLSSRLLPASLHPNAAGYARLAEVVAKGLGAEVAPRAGSAAVAAAP
jgi:lysophospholipase L1-like esterase